MVHQYANLVSMQQTLVRIQLYPNEFIQSYAVDVQISVAVAECSKTWMSPVSRVLFETVSYPSFTWSHLMCLSLSYLNQMVCYSDPSTMVPGIWKADQNSNGGLNTDPLSKWWFEYQATMVLGIWMANHLSNEEVKWSNKSPWSEYRTSLLFKSPL